ncbi:flavin-containing amine oxidoreductase [Stachybotrys elegans]|uniref:Flavin-containing amine oxidoreductase n=1 Tax=Stachybotrys elegans TaxID=80388 RepID=A0A8K0T4R5_9HYPO|nr:flavin-containing amine oxidoreductase [Stachybotrys elegans]
MPSVFYVSFRPVSRLVSGSGSGRAPMVSSFLKAALWASPVLGATSSLPIQLETRGDLTSHLANIHLSYNEPVEGAVHFSYGSCHAESDEDAHHSIGLFPVSEASRLVWIIPKGAENGGCISAWNASGDLVGRSDAQKLHRVRRRNPRKRSTCAGIPMTNASGIDPLGPWFDGVELLSQKQPSPVNVEAAKQKDIAIVGAGMSGLMTYLVLSQAGFTNLTLVEASQRVGGRIRTAYLTGGSFDYSYQEMGAMRFPATYQDPISNETLNINDHHLVFDLAAEMNRLNGNDRDLSVDFVNWIQWNSNSFYYFNDAKLETGLPPTVAQVQANGSNTSPALDPTVEELLQELYGDLPGPDFSVRMAQNMFKAHREWIDGGLDGRPGDQWSEFSYLVQALGASLNSTDQIANRPVSFWETIYEGFFFTAASWRTIDGGLNRLPNSFLPLVKDDLKLGRKIERIRYSQESKKLTLQWPNSGETESSSHDYVVVSAPFAVLRTWRLPSLPTTISNAINRYTYAAACKVALEFSERFWEHYETPIFGGCGTRTDIPYIGSLCYPSYNLNGTGPASILASYNFGDFAYGLGAMPEEEHVRLVLDAVIEIHGEDKRALYTGNYNRQCWHNDPYAGMAWGSPTVGQHELYMPEYFKTHSNMIFIGEQTSAIQGWISGALESGIRGGVQLMLELGLVDEAKETVNKWMARWIDV